MAPQNSTLLHENVELTTNLSPILNTIAYYDATETINCKSEATNIAVTSGAAVAVDDVVEFIDPQKPTGKFNKGTNKQVYIVKKMNKNMSKNQIKQQSGNIQTIFVSNFILFTLHFGFFG